jgi:hypothetical protein
MASNVKGVSDHLVMGGACLALAAGLQGVSYLCEGGRRSVGKIPVVNLIASAVLYPVRLIATIAAIYLGFVGTFFLVKGAQLHLNMAPIDGSFLRTIPAVFQRLLPQSIIK